MYLDKIQRKKSTSKEMYMKILTLYLMGRFSEPYNQSALRGHSKYIIV